MFLLIISTLKFKSLLSYSAIKSFFVYDELAVNFKPTSNFPTFATAFIFSSIFETLTDLSLSICVGFKIVAFNFNMFLPDFIKCKSFLSKCSIVSPLKSQINEIFDN